MQHRTRLVTAVVLGVTATALPASAERTNGVYAEVLGKGGLWGLGYDHRVHHRFSVGAVGSAYSIEGQRYVTLSPYLGAYLLRSGRSAWFADAGAQVVHAWAPSPVPEWMGTSSTGVGGILSTGYEFRGRLLYRVFAHGAIGKGGAVPWLGTSIGWAF